VNTSSKDRFEATLIVSLDPSRGDFTSVQDALAALPASGGKISVRAGQYPAITGTLRIRTNNGHYPG
jgi:hypothetical protein